MRSTSCFVSTLTGSYPMGKSRVILFRKNDALSIRSRRSPRPLVHANWCFAVGGHGFDWALAGGEGSKSSGKAGDPPAQSDFAPNVLHKNGSLSDKFVNKELNGDPVGTGGAVNATGSNPAGRFVGSTYGVTTSASPQKTIYQP